MKTQLKGRQAELLLKYPAVATIYGQNTSQDDKIKMSLSIFVQVADGEVMLEQRHPRSEVWRNSATSSKGVRFESIVPITDANELLDYTILSLKELFDCCPENKVDHVLWTRRYYWINEDGKKVERELEVVVLTKPKDKTWKQLVQEGLKAKEERETAYLRPPTHTPELIGIKKALSKSPPVKMHVFRSGGGLRVVRIEEKRKLIAYGESPTLEDALRRANNDFLKIRPRKSEIEYLTGQSFASSNIDAWVLRGQTIDLMYDSKFSSFVAILEGYEDQEIPDDVQKMAEANPGVTIYHTSRGLDFATTYYQNYFADGSQPMRAFMYKVRKQGEGATFWEAFQNSLTAPSIEILE